MKNKKNKQQVSDPELVKKILGFRRALRDTESDIKINENTEQQLKEKRETVGKLRTIISNLENASFRNVNKGMYIGLGINLLRQADNQIKPTYLDWDKITNHVGVLGASGVGKTILMLSNIKDTIDKGWSSIIVDPKGGNGQEIVNATYSYAKEKNLLKNTYYLSPAMPENSLLINPNFGLTNIEIATSIRDMMMGDNTEDFYGDITYKTVLSILMCFQFLESVQDEDGSIARQEIDAENQRHEDYMRLNSLSTDIDTANSSVEEGVTNNLHRDSILIANDKIKSKRTLVTYRDLAKEVSHTKLSDLKELVENTFIPDDVANRPKMEKLREQALNVIEDTLKQEKDFFGKVSTSLSTLLTKLSAEEIGDIFCTIRTNPLIAKLGKQDHEQFILLVQPFSIRFGNIANTVVELVLKQVTTLIGNVGSTERIINRIAFFIDEFGSVLYEDITDLFNKARSLGVTLFVYTQSYQDYVDAIGEAKAKIVMDNINTTIRMRMNDIESAERVVSELSTTKEFTSTTVASTGTTDSRVIVQKSEEDVISPTDVTLLPIGRGIVKYDGEILLVDFAHYGKIYSSIKFSTNKYFEEIDRQSAISNNKRFL